MELGAFSVSLTVKDIDKSVEFYRKLGFTVISGKPDEKWLILRNKDAIIGLFEGIIGKNLLTFNPGWDQHSTDLNNFTDIREIEKSLKEQGLTLIDRTAPDSRGPDFITLEDPDGNPILIDQHRDS